MASEKTVIGSMLRVCMFSMLGGGIFCHFVLFNSRAPPIPDPYFTNNIYIYIYTSEKHLMSSPRVNVSCTLTSRFIFCVLYFLRPSSSGHTQGTRSAPDTVIALPLTLEEVFHGKTTNVTVARERLCGTCGGTGAADPAEMPTVKTKLLLT